VTVVGLPLAIFVFLFQQRKERENEEEEVYQLLSDNYQEFLKVALSNPDLHLFSSRQAHGLARCFLSSSPAKIPSSPFTSRSSLNAKPGTRGRWVETE
jgi:hypothetical protein